MREFDVKFDCDQLAAILEKLARLQESLHQTIGAKLDAMRRADVPAMLEASRSEADLAAAIEACDAQRREIAARLCSQLNLSYKGAVSLRHIVAKLPGALGQHLSGRAARLRERMLKVAEANRVVEIVCREMLSHFRTLFAVMLQDESAAGSYGRGGHPGRPSGSLIVDAVG